MNNLHDKRERTLFVSMIHRSISDDDLYELLRQAGPIEKIIFKENEDGSLLHALVIFRNVESVVFSMHHLFPLVRNTGLIHIRPLRESSHHSLYGSNYSTVVQTADEMSSQKVLHHLKDRNDVVSWAHQQPMDKLFDKLFTLPCHSPDINNLTPSNPNKATCVAHGSSSHSMISKLYSVHSPLLSQKLPVNCNSYRGYLESSNSRTIHSPIYCSTHRGRCSKICCAKI